MDLVLSPESQNTIAQAEILEPAVGAITLDALKLRLAEQIAPRRWRRSLGRLAHRVDQGQPLDEVFRVQQGSLPRELRCLMQEALRTKDPASLLVDALRIRDDVRQSWRELMSLILYPLCLFVFALAVGVAFSFTMQNVVDFTWIDEFGLAGFERVNASIQDQHHAILGLGTVTAWVGIVLLTIAVLGPPWAWVAVVGGMVVVGKPLRWISLQEILHRFQLFAREELSTSDLALRVSRSFGSSSQAVVSKVIAHRIDAGMPLGRALGASLLADGLCRPALHLLDHRGGDMVGGLEETAHLLGRLCEQRCRTLATILPIFGLALIGTILWASLNSYFMGMVPLVRMITSLCIAMIAYSSNWFILFPIAFSLFVAMRLSLGSVDQNRSSFGVLALRSVIAVLLFFSLVAVGLRFSFLSFLWILLLAIFAWILFWKNRRLERSAMLLTTLGAAAHGLQQSSVAFFSEENEGWLRRRADLIRRDLAAGVLWPKSLELRGVARSVYERLAVRLRAAYGPEKRADLSSEPTFVLSPLQIEAEVERLLGRLMIFSWVVVVAPIITMIMTFIVPTFKEMFEEFGIPLPNMTLNMIAAADFTVESGLIYGVALIPMIIMALLIVAFAAWLFPSLLQSPLLRWLCQDYFRNVGFTTLARVIDKESNLVQACRETAGLIPVAYVAQRYHVATTLLERGIPPADAFLKARLLDHREFRIFGRGFDQRDPTWGLQQLASWKIERMLNRYSVIVQMLVVAITFVIALIVGLVAIGVLQALSLMITLLAFVN